MAKKLNITYKIQENLIKQYEHVKREVHSYQTIFDLLSQENIILKARMIQTESLMTMFKETIVMIKKELKDFDDSYDAFKEQLEKLAQDKDFMVFMQKSEEEKEEKLKADAEEIETNDMPLKTEEAPQDVAKKPRKDRR